MKICLDNAMQKKYHGAALRIQHYLVGNKRMQIFKITSLLILCFGVGLLLPYSSMGRHHCPEAPSISPSILSTSQVFVASTIASSIATGRSSNTSGCDRGHPSKSFYRPTGAIYLEHTLEQVVEESSRGHGQHLEALASLAGCSTKSFVLFSKALQKNYEQLFTEQEYLPLDKRSDQIWRKVGNLITHDPKLQQMCS